MRIAALSYAALQRSGSPAIRRARPVTSRWSSIASVSVSSHCAVIGVEVGSVDARKDLERRQRLARLGLALPHRGHDLREVLGDELAVALDVGLDVGERAPVAGQAQARVQRLDDVERAQELADGVGRVAEVEEREDAPEQVIAGDQQAALGLEQAHVRGRVAGGLVDGPRAEVGLDDNARQQLAVGLDHRGDPRFARAALGGVAAQRLLGHAALARDLQAAFQRGVGILGPQLHVRVVGVHPQLAAGALHDRRGLAVVVGVGVRADHQAHVLDAQPAHLHRPFQLRERAGLVHPRVEQHDPVAGRDRPGVAVGDAWPGQRQAQAKDAGQHAFAPASSSRLTLICTSAHHGQETRLRSADRRRRDGRGGERQRGRREGAGGRGERAPGVETAQTHGAAARPRRSRGATSRRSTRTTSTAPRRCGRRAAARTCAVRSTSLAPGGRARVHRRADRGDARPAHGGLSHDDRGRALRRAVAPDAARSPGRATSTAIAPTGDRIELEGFDLLTRARRADPGQTTRSPTRWPFPARSG